MTINFAAYHNKQKTLSEMSAGLGIADLHRLLDEQYDYIEAQLEGLNDAEVTYIPLDPEAYDPYAADEAEIKLAWTLGHVIVHLSASAEEATAQATNLARGVKVRGRSRYETPWQSVKSASQVLKRLAESRRMQHALLEAWPTEPDLELTYTPAYPGAQPRNAIGYFISGLAHSDSHLKQIENILTQARTSP